MSDVNALSALNAYRNQLKLANESGDSADTSGASGAGGSNFAQMVQDAVQGAADSQYKAEAIETQSISTGKVELTDLVTAVANAELSLNTVVAVRDKVINAYQDIIKMSI